MFAAAGALHLALLPRLYVGFFNDDAQFLNLARSLLRGRFESSCFPGHPPETAYMPGFPLLLAPFVGLFAPHWAWFKLLPVALFLGSGFLLWRLFADWLSDEARLASLALFLFSPVAAALAGALMSEQALLFAVLLAFLALRRLVERDGQGLSWALGGLLAWAALIHPIAAVLLPIAAAVLIPGRGWRTALRVLTPSLGAITLLALRNRLAGGDPLRYGSFFIMSLRQLAANPALLLDNWHRVAYLVFAHALLSLRLPHAGWGLSASSAAIAAGAGLTWHGFSAMLRERRAPRALVGGMGAFVAACVLVHAFWPIIEPRYVLPFLPFLLAFFVQGARRACLRLPRSRLWIAGGLAALAAAAFAQDARLLLSMRAPSAEEGVIFPRETLAWISRNTPADAVILTKAPMVYLYTNREGLPQVLAENSEDFRYLCLRQGLTHVLSLPYPVLFIPGGLTTDHARAWKRNMGWAASWAEAFPAVYANPREGTSVYRVAPDPDYLRAYELQLSAREDFANGRDGDGLRNLERALKLEPRLAGALDARGAALLRAGDLAGSEESLRRALAVRPDHALALVDMARLRARQGRRREALRFYDEARAAMERTGEFEGLGPALAAESGREAGQ